MRNFPLVDPVWIAELDATPFLTRCRTGEITMDELRSFLAQQYFYSRHFTRYLCALLSNILDEKDRLALTDNLIDETGLGIDKGIPHSVLYRQMLERLGVNPQRHSVLPETQALIDTMFESCRNSNPVIGLGALCLGAEAIVSHLYAQIVQGFRAHGITENNLDFFHIHIACDDEHAETMREIILRGLTTQEQKLALKCAAQRAIAARARFFSALCGSSIQKEKQHACV